MRHFEVRRSLSHDTCILPGRTIGNFKANCTISRTLRVSCNWPARCAQYRSIFMTVVPYMARIEANPPRICTLYCTVTGSYDSCPQMEVAAVEIQQLNREKKSISSSPQNLRENEPTTRVGSWVKTINLLHTSSSTAKGRVCVCVCVCVWPPPRWWRGDDEGITFSQNQWKSSLKNCVSWTYVSILIITM